MKLKKAFLLAGSVLGATTLLATPLFLTSCSCSPQEQSSNNGNQGPQGPGGSGNSINNTWDVPIIPPPESVNNNVVDIVWDNPSPLIQRIISQKWGIENEQWLRQKTKTGMADGDNCYFMYMGYPFSVWTPPQDTSAVDPSPPSVNPPPKITYTLHTINNLKLYNFGVKNDYLFLSLDSMSLTRMSNDLRPLNTVIRDMRDYYWNNKAGQLIAQTTHNLQPKTLIVKATGEIIEHGLPPRVSIQAWSSIYLMDNLKNKVTADNWTKFITPCKNAVDDNDIDTAPLSFAFYSDKEFYDVFATQLPAYSAEGFIWNWDKFLNYSPIKERS